MAAEFQVLSIRRAAVKRNAVLLALVVNVDGVAGSRRTIHLGQVLAVLEHILNVALDFLVGYADIVRLDLNALVLAERNLTEVLRLLREVCVGRGRALRSRAAVRALSRVLLAAGRKRNCHRRKTGHQQQLFR